MACSDTKNVQKPPLGDLGVFDKQGHRGSRGLMPENTWPAMKTALDLGVLQKIKKWFCRMSLSLVMKSPLNLMVRM
jgi:hypothetical protein